jgi:tyrosine-protein phosphatase OCA1
MHRLLESKLQPTLLMDAGAGHRVGAVVGCLRKLQNWCTSSILDEYRRYAGNKARDNVEHFMELFDTDLVHFSVRPSWLYVVLLNALQFLFSIIFCQVRIF